MMMMVVVVMMAEPRVVVVLVMPVIFVLAAVPVRSLVLVVLLIHVVSHDRLVLVRHRFLGVVLDAFIVIVWNGRRICWIFRLTCELIEISAGIQQEHLWMWGLEIRMKPMLLHQSISERILEFDSRSANVKLPF